MLIKTKSVVGICVLFLLLPTIATGDNPPENDTRASTQATYQLRSSVLGAAGSSTTGGEYNSKGTLGQSMAMGTCGSSDDTLYAGFWKSYLMMIRTSVSETPEPLVNRLYQNFPNPFNPTTTIKYSLAKASPVQITIYNVAGQVVKLLVNEHKPKGRYNALWNGINDRGEMVSSGVYFYLLRIGAFTDVKKMVILK